MILSIWHNLHRLLCPPGKIAEFDAIDREVARGQETVPYSCGARAVLERCVVTRPGGEPTSQVVRRCQGRRRRVSLPPRHRGGPGMNVFARIHRNTAGKVDHPLMFCGTEPDLPMCPSCGISPQRCAQTKINGHVACGSCWTDPTSALNQRLDELDELDELSDCDIAAAVPR